MFLYVVFSCAPFLIETTEKTNAFRTLNPYSGELKDVGDDEDQPVDGQEAAPENGGGPPGEEASVGGEPDEHVRHQLAVGPRLVNGLLQWFGTYM